MVTAVIVAGGSGSRMGSDKNKVFLPLSGKTVIEHTVATFLSVGQIENIVIVTREQDIEECKKLFSDDRITFTVGGKTRQESVSNGLGVATGEIVAIHDAARALIDKDTIEKTIADCKEFGAATVGVPCVDTLKRKDKDGFIAETVDRTDIYRIQTPQVFYKEEIKRAHRDAVNDKFDATDDCALYEKYIGRVKICEGSANNIKITYPEDLAFAEAILKTKGE